MAHHGDCIYAGHRDVSGSFYAFRKADRRFQAGSSAMPAFYWRFADVICFKLLKKRLKIVNIVLIICFFLA